MKEIIQFNNEYVNLVEPAIIVTIILTVIKYSYDLHVFFIKDNQLANYKAFIDYILDKKI